MRGVIYRILDKDVDIDLDLDIDKDMDIQNIVYSDYRFFSDGVATGST